MSNSVLTSVVLWCVKVYQMVFSSLVGNCCRMHPTCSVYSIQAINEFGVLKGLFLAFKRVLRCNPWCEGGVDLPSCNMKMKTRNLNGL